MKKRVSRYFLIVFGLLVLACIPLACRFNTISGRNPGKEEQKKFEKLSNYKEGKFQNPNNVVIDWSHMPFGKVMRDYWNKPASVVPSRTMPSVKRDLKGPIGDTPEITWFGHSSVLIRTKDLNVLLDPSFCGYGSPFSFSINSFEGANEYTVDDLPDIDILLVSHDHYDHLDYESEVKLQPKVKRAVLPLGMRSHFEYWGWDMKKISELNWYETLEVFPGVSITITPTQHQSGRGMAFQKTLWASFVMDLKGSKLFYSGDGGYAPHFKTIGEKYGPFDLVLLECGQYNESWHVVHMYPEETAQAAIDLKGKMLLPVHWAKYPLSIHPWNEPVKRLLVEADRLGLPVTVPMIGEPYLLGSTVKRAPWWSFE